MARDQRRRPVTEEELEGLRDEIRDQRSHIRDELAEAGVDVSSWSVPGEDDADDESDVEESA